MGQSIIMFLAGAAIVWSLLPLLRHDRWWVRAFDFPRLQVAALNIAILVACLLTGALGSLFHGLLTAGLAACVVHQIIQIAPYTPLHGKELRAAVDAGAANRIGILAANVLTPNRNADRLLQIIRECDPDLVLAVETDDWWQSRLDVLEPDYPFSVKYPLDNLYGMHLYSRLRLVDPRVEFLVEDDVPSIHADVVLRSGHRIALHCLHPAPPSPTENPTAAERDAELLVVGRAIAASPRSSVVVGDLNDVCWSATTRLFKRISGLLDPRIGRGPLTTFPAGYPLLRWPMDHVFCTDDFAVASLVCLPAFGSDHLPIHVALVLAPGVPNDRVEPPADADDHARAREKIDKVDADRQALQ